MIGTTNWAMPEDYQEEWEPPEMSFNGVKFPRQQYEFETTMKLDGASFHELRARLFNKPEDWN